MPGLYRVNLGMFSVISISNYTPNGVINQISLAYS